MSNIRVYTNDGRPSGLTPTSGTKVFAGDTPIDMVTALELVAETSGAWTLKISVHVDPAKLFAVLPVIETTNLMSEDRSFVAGKPA